MAREALLLAGVIWSRLAGRGRRCSRAPGQAR
jgi:hypothetical protein